MSSTLVGALYGAVALAACILAFRAGVRSGRRREQHARELLARLDVAVDLGCRPAERRRRATGWVGGPEGCLMSWAPERF